MHALTLLAHSLWQGAGPAISADLPALLTSFLALAGWAALVAALINAGKFLGWVPDGQAPNVSITLNVLGFAVLTILRLFRPDIDVAGVDALLATLATVLTSALALLTQLGVTKLINNGIKGLPVIGFSHSRKLLEAKTVVPNAAR